MSDWSLIDYDPITKTSSWSRWEDGRFMVKTMSATDMQRKVAAEQRALTAGRGWGGDHHHVASIPGHVLFNSDIFEAVRDGDQKYFARWLNDGDNAAFRTKEGKV